MAIRKLKNKGWYVDISYGYDPITQKQRRIIRKGFKTKKEAIEAEQYLRTIKLNEKPFGYKISVSLLYHLLTIDDRTNNRKESYINTQENNYNRHIKDYFSQVEDISKISYEDIYKFRETLLNKKTKNSETTLTNNTINKIMILLKKIFDVGVKNRYINQNPVALLKKLPIEKNKMKFWTIKQFQHFITLFNEDEYHLKLLFTLLFFTGLRLGEALALTWNDLDHKNNIIFVTKSVYVKNGKSYVNSPKTKSGTRKIFINNKLCEELLKWKAMQKNILNEFTDDINELQIFQNSPIQLTKDAIDKKYKKILNRDTNLEKIRIHDFRHSHASLLINNGEDYLVVKERLGHASITTTIDIYSHLYPSKQKTLADKLDNLL